MGRRPELKSDEFCDANVKVIEIVSHLRLKPQKQVVQLLAARPAGPAAQSDPVEAGRRARAAVRWVGVGFLWPSLGLRARLRQGGARAVI